MLLTVKAFPLCFLSRRKIMKTNYATREGPCELLKFQLFVLRSLQKSSAMTSYELNNIFMSLR